MKEKCFNSVPSEGQAEIDALETSQVPIRTGLIPGVPGDWSQARRGLSLSTILVFISDR